MLAIMVPAVLAGVVAGWLRAGSRLPDHLPLRGAIWIVLSLTLQVITVRWAHPLGPTAMGVLFVGSMLLLLAGVWQDRSPAMALVGLGIGLNLAVMLANGGLMPLPADVMARQGHRPAVTVGEVPSHSKGRIADPAGVRLWALADVIGSPDGGLLSVGDVVLAIGVGVLAWERLVRRSSQYASQSVS